MMAADTPVRLALVGAGIFARDTHLPAIQALGDTYEIVAVCSRREESARKLARLLDHPVDVTTDYLALLDRSDIDAVNLIVPIPLLPPMVESALAAGKHVISEKPVAPTVAIGRELLGKVGDQVWMVAENWRYVSSFLQAADHIQRGDIGDVRFCHFAAPIAMNTSNKFYHTDWRRAGDFPGGFILDAGVHHAAVLRLLLGEIASVSAYVAQMNPDLPPADTLSAALRFDSGVLGTYSITFAASVSERTGVHVIGSQGSLQAFTDELQVMRGSEMMITRFRNDGIENELAAFAAAIRDGAAHRNPAAAALQDVAVIEAMLHAAATGQAAEPARISPPA